MTRGTLRDGEPHPAAAKALEFIRSLGAETLLKLNESFSSCAIEGNRLGEICGETLHRLLNGDPVSDRYLLGLAWALMELECADVLTKLEERSEV